MNLSPKLLDVAYKRLFTKPSRMKTERKKSPIIKHVIKWIILILLALLVVAHIFRQLRWT